MFNGVFVQKGGTTFFFRDTFLLNYTLFIVDRKKCYPLSATNFNEIIRYDLIYLIVRNILHLNCCII